MSEILSDLFFMLLLFILFFMGMVVGIAITKSPEPETIIKVVEKEVPVPVTSTAFNIKCYFYDESLEESER